MSTLFLSTRTVSFMPNPQINLHLVLLSSDFYPFETFGRSPEISKAIQLKSLPYSVTVAQVKIFGIKPESSIPLVSYIQNISKPYRFYFQCIFRTQYFRMQPLLAFLHCHDPGPSPYHASPLPLPPYSLIHKRSEDPIDFSSVKLGHPSAQGFLMASHCRAKARHP